MTTIKSMMGKMLSHWIYFNCVLGNKEKLSGEVSAKWELCGPLRRQGVYIQLKEEGDGQEVDECGEFSTDFIYLSPSSS